MTAVAAAEAWDAAVKAAASPEPAPLLQTWAWGQVQAGAGWSLARLHLPGGGLASVQLRGSGPLREAYVPRGPVPADAAALEALSEWARSERLAALRVEPEAGPEIDDGLRQLGFHPVRAVQPQHSLLIPLGSDAEMLAAFKPKTRYNVRLSERRGVKVRVGEDAAELVRQSDATARRQGIRLASRAYYESLLRTLPWCQTFVAEVGGKPCAAILVAAHGPRAYYLFGGSDGWHREAMPSHAAQWAAMRAAAAAGCVDYDMWGLPPSADPLHPWAGLWQFKTGFGGRRIEYSGAWQLTLSPWQGLAEGLFAARRAAGRLLHRP